LTDDRGHAEARDRALTLLARREHSCDELRRKLAQKGFSPTAAAVVAELERAGLVSDQRYAEALVRSRRQRGYGPVKIQQELRAKGVAADLAEVAVDPGAPEWAELLCEVWNKKFGGRKPRDYREWARQARFLEGRGFNAEQIRRVVGQY
jgi:regulatory protein